MSTIPPITDHLALAIRAYTGPMITELPDGKKRKKAEEKLPAPASDWTLIFDTETTTDASQALRFGTYQFRCGDELDEEGLFYDPEAVSSSELEVLSAYAAVNAVELRTRSEFVDEIFFRRAYMLRATIVGFNLPFDISRIAIDHGTAKNRLTADSAPMRGAFTFKVSAQKIWPYVRVKHLSRKSALIAFAGTKRQKDARGQRKRGLITPTRRGHFVDVKTVAAAMYARGFKLKELGAFLKVSTIKKDFDEFDGLITEEMIGYALADTQTTWECYRELRQRFGELGFTRTVPEKIYSEASIGKAHLREMGVRPWRQVQPDFPRHLLAKIMGSYFGGRSEVRIRRELRQVVLCDFLSMYPTVCTLMNLWRFVITKGMTWRDTTEETRKLLDETNLAGLQSKATWTRLATLVRVHPRGEIFPVRAAYCDEPQTTIGANHLTAEPLWFTLADCLAAKLLTGKTPEVLEAITFEPGPPQDGLQPINIAGNSDYRIDPYEDDFFKRLIELRKEVQNRKKHANADEIEQLETEQYRLKITANSVSYGIYIEVNVDSRNCKRPTTVHSSTCEPFSFRTDKSELPGSYFHPLLGTLITGAARLMVAIAETLTIGKGLDWSFCDTDSIAIAKPNSLNSNEFQKRVNSIVNWFAELNPYSFSDPILKIEEVNSALTTGQPEPLYCWAISSKRYALFNLNADGKPVLRKVSAHGLGQYWPPYSEHEAPNGIPAPDKTVLGNGIHRWHCDFWFQIVTAALSGTPDQVACDYHPGLNQPAVSRYGATTPELLKWFSTYNSERPYRSQVKPFNFLFAMSAAPEEPAAEIVVRKRPGRRKARQVIKPIAPFDKSIKNAQEHAFDRETCEKIPTDRLKTLAQALAQYHVHPESKFLNGDYSDRGTTRRRHVYMTSTRHIGKESNDWEQQALLGLNPEAELSYGLGSADGAALASELRGMVAQWRILTCARALDISGATIRRLIENPDSASDATLQKVAARLPGARQLFARTTAEHFRERKSLEDAIRRDGLRSTARRLGIDASNLRRKLRV